MVSFRHAVSCSAAAEQVHTWQETTRTQQKQVHQHSPWEHGQRPRSQLTTLDQVMSGATSYLTFAGTTSNCIACSQKPSCTASGLRIHFLMPSLRFAVFDTSCMCSSTPVGCMLSGAFDLPELPKGPAFTLGTRQAPSATADSSATPGPAAYDVAGAAAALDAATPAWTMGQRPKEQSAGQSFSC